MNYDSLTVTIFSQVLRMCIWKCFLVHVDNSYVFLFFSEQWQKLSGKFRREIKTNG